jgi:hypothetical protein
LDLAAGIKGTADSVSRGEGWADVGKTRIVEFVSERAWHPPARPGGGISAVEPAQVAAFGAFRRPVGDADRALCADAVWLGRLGDAQAGNDINPSLARRVYAGSEGSVYVVPGAGALCYIAVGADGGTVIGTTTTAVAAKDGLGTCEGAGVRH